MNTKNTPKSFIKNLKNSKKKKTSFSLPASHLRQLESSDNKPSQVMKCYIPKFKDDAS